MKKILSKILVLVLCAIACVGFTACGGGDYVNAKINVKLYNGDKEAVTMTLDYKLYRHFAANSVDQFVSLAKEGYYNNTFFYKTGDSVASNTMMIGAFKYDGEKVVANKEVTTIAGEFAKGGTTGSNLKAKTGNLCVWRFYDAKSDMDTSGFETGSAGILMIPTYSSMFEDTANDSTTVTVMGELNDSDAFDLIRGRTVNEVSYTNWDETETYYAFYYYTNEEKTEISSVVVLSADDYNEAVKNGKYTVKAANEEDPDSVYTVFDPADTKLTAYATTKYATRKLTLPKYEYRIVIESISF